MRHFCFLTGLFVVLVPLTAEAGPADSPATPVLAPGESPNGLPALDLNAALQEFDRNSPNLGAARAHLDESRAVIQEARAALQPTAQAAGSYVRNNAEVALNLGALLAQIPGAPNIPSTVIQPLDAWTASAAVRVPVFALSSWYDVDVAIAAVGVGEATFESSRQQSHAALATLAYAQSALEEVVHASERAVELAAEQVSSAERRTTAGTAAPLDVLRARTEFVSRQSDLARANADLGRARLALGVLLGRKGPVVVRVPEAEVFAAEPTRAGTRAELQALDARSRLAKAQLESAKARLWPTLSATGTVFASNQPYPTGDKTGWRVGAELTIPLYDGGYRYGKRHEAEAALRATAAELEAKELSIQQETSDAEREIAVALERKRLAETRSGLAADAAASAKRSFDAGIATTLDVLDANDKLYKAEVALAEAKARLAQAHIELLRAKGAQP